MRDPNATAILSVLLLVLAAACGEPRSAATGVPSALPEQPSPVDGVIVETDCPEELHLLPDAPMEEVEEAVLMDTEIIQSQHEHSEAAFDSSQWNTSLGNRSSDEAMSERYAFVGETGFAVTAQQRSASFGVDVDTAAWSNVRRILRGGSLPPVDAVRIEEMLNAFDYGDAPPTGREPFALRTAQARCPWNGDHRLLRIGLRTRPIDAAAVPPCNLVFLVDVSGSMRSARKLPLVKRAFGLLIDQLRPRDRVSIVTYASGTRVRLEGATGAEPARIRTALLDLSAHGGTNGEGGIQRAYEIAAKHRIAEGVNRVILATDGDFNVGIRSTDELESFICARRDEGVFLSVLGFGAGNLRDDTLETLASNGNGSHAYIDTLAEARRVFIDQFGASLMTIAKDVKLQVEFNPRRVAGYRLLGYENRRMSRREFRDDAKDSGELGAGHAITALFEVVPAGGEVAAARPRPGGAPATGLDEDDDAVVRVRFKAPLADRARQIDAHVAHVAEADLAAPETAAHDVRLAASVAGFAMLLRSSPHARAFDWDQVLALARPLAAAADPRQARQAQELIELIETARELARAAHTPR